MTMALTHFNLWEAPRRAPATPAGNSVLSRYFIILCNHFLLFCWSELILAVAAGRQQDSLIRFSSFFVHFQLFGSPSSAAERLIFICCVPAINVKFTAECHLKYKHSGSPPVAILYSFFFFGYIYLYFVEGRTNGFYARQMTPLSMASSWVKRFFWLILYLRALKDLKNNKSINMYLKYYKLL